MNKLPAGTSLLPLLDIGKHGTYSSAHSRTSKLRGKASTYWCIHCMGPAAEWALMKPRHHGTVKRYGRETKVEWSMNPNDYAPMCKRCHVTFDNATRAKRRAMRALLTIKWNVM